MAGRSAHTVKDLLDKTRAFFADRGLDTPRLDAELLLCDALGLDRVQLYTEFHRPLHDDEVAAYRARVKRRAGRESVAHIVGGREFYGLFIGVDEHVLVPRPETEHLVDEALARLPADVTGRIADVGTGSGAVALAVLKERPGLTAVCTDVSAPALAKAAHNAARHGLEARVRFLEGDLLAPLEDERDLLCILSNPPYIRRDAAATLAPEVHDHEPHAALFGIDPDGLGHHRQLLAGAAAHLAPGGFVALECGFDQGDALLACAHPGLSSGTAYRDLSGHTRGAVFGSAAQLS